MAYLHTGAKPVTCKQDPADPDGSDWVYFSYGSWLRTGETITAHSGVVTGGTLETESTYIGAITDEEGVEYTEVYAVQFKPAAGNTTVTVTHRKSTTTSGIDLPRENIDHSVILPVKEL